jgi:hypothetical protein
MTRIAVVVLLAVMLATTSLFADTFISAEPIPSEQIVGQANLAKIESVGYSNLELWSTRLLNDCRIVDNVIDALVSNGAVTTVRSNAGNTKFLVAAGGFQTVTDPSYVFTIKDAGPGAVSASDVAVLDNALGYVLNQGGTVHFSPDHPKAYDFPLDYAVATLPGTLTGVEAKAFFDYLGTIDPALWSGTFAGFTQIDFMNSPTNNSMLFLKPAVSKNRLIAGLAAAVSGVPGATYFPLNNHGQPTTAQAGVSFPGNDWIAFPNGDQYLSHLGSPSAGLLDTLTALRQLHLKAVSNLLSAIDKGNVSLYLNRQFKCPT